MIRGGLVSLYVRDVGAAVRFYVETLGMKLIEESGPGWSVIDAGGGLRIGLHAGPPDAPRGAGAPRVGLSPKIPIREALAILENRGVVFDVTTEGHVTIATFHDPDGNTLYLHQ
jgi:catechol 2,3-dioxygenase-like lactoylglutathione lyase family enzyme